MSLPMMLLAIYLPSFSQIWYNMAGYLVKRPVAAGRFFLAFFHGRSPSNAMIWCWY